MFGQVKILVYLTIVMLACGYGWLRLVRPERLAPVDRRLAAMMLAILIAGYLVPSFWLLYALLFVLPLALGRTRMDVCVVFVIAVLGVPLVGQALTIGSHYLTPIDTTRVLALGALVAFFAKPRPAGPPLGRKFDLPFLILFAITILAQVRGQNITSLIRTISYETIGLAVPYYILSRSIRRPADVSRLLLVIVFGAFVLSIMSIYETLRSWPIYLHIDSRLGSGSALSQNFKMRAGLMRTATSFAESTSYAVFLAMALVAAMASRPAFRSAGRFMMVIGVILLGLMLTQARGGWLAAAVGILAYNLYTRQYSRLAIQMTTGALGALLVVFAAQGSARLSEAIGLSGSSVGTVDYRVQLYRRSMEEIRKHPFIGNGLTNAMRDLNDLRQGENIVDFVNGYLYFGVTLGIPGAVALFLLFATLAVRMLADRRPRSAGPPDVAGAWVFAVALLSMVSAGTSGFGGRPIIFLIVALAIGSVHRGLNRRPAVRDGASAARLGPAMRSRPPQPA